MKADGFSVSPDGRRVLSYRVKDCDAGFTLVARMVDLFPSYPCQAWLAAIAEGTLTVDGATPDSEFKLVEGMFIAYRSAPVVEPNVDEMYDIVFEDEHIAVVNKSGNLPCHPAGRYYEHSLSRMLVARNGFPNAFLVNRIDRETSGLVMVAKTQDAASRCGLAMMAGRYAKHYLVLVEGEWSLAPCGEAYNVTGTIKLVRGLIVRKKRVFVENALDGKGQIAETNFKCVWTCNGLSLLEAEPITGRPHQIRATLKAIGYPVVGDKLYGIDETIYARMDLDAITEQDLAALRMKRQALHSWRLEFRHPFSGDTISLEAPPPQGEALWEQPASDLQARDCLQEESKSFAQGNPPVLPSSCEQSRARKLASHGESQ